MQKAFYCLDDVSALCGNLRTSLKDPREKAQLVTCLKHNTRQTLSRDSSPSAGQPVLAGPAEPRISHSCPGTGRGEVGVGRALLAAFENRVGISDREAEAEAENEAGDAGEGGGVFRRHSSITAVPVFGLGLSVSRNVFMMETRLPAPRPPSLGVCKAG